MNTAIEELFHQYADDIFRYARYTVGNPDDAKDVVQEVFLRAFRSWSSFRQQSAAKTWLLRIARNLLHDRYRKLQREKRFFDSPHAAIEPAGQLETWVELQDALALLKWEWRQVLILRYVEDLSSEETGKILGWTPGRVRTVQHRALKRLKELMDDSRTCYPKGGETH